MRIHKIVILKIILTLVVFADDYYSHPLFQNKAFQQLLTKEINVGRSLAYDEPTMNVDNQYLKVEIPLLKYILKKDKYHFPSKEKFDKLIKKYFPQATQKSISRKHKSEIDFYTNDMTSWGIDVIILREEQFITLAYRLPEIVYISKVSKDIKALAITMDKNTSALLSPWSVTKNPPKGEKFNENVTHEIVAINKYLFNHNSTQFKYLIKNHLTTMNDSTLLKIMLMNALPKDLGWFFNHMKNKKDFKSRNIWLDTLHYQEIMIPQKGYKSFFDLCKNLGFKENEIRALNPWIDKEASNISKDKMMIIPNYKKEDKQ